MSDEYKANGKYDPIENRIDEILDGADGIDFDPREAGYTEIAPGFWDDGTEFGGFYVETDHLDTKYKRDVSPKNNFYWLSKKSFMMPWVYILLLVLAWSLFWLWYTITYRAEELNDILMLNYLAYIICIFFTFSIIFGDLTCIPYHYDRKKNRVQKIVGEIWYISTESEVNVIKAGETTRYFPESLRIQRSKIIFRDINSDFMPQCEKRLNPYDHEKIPKSVMEDLKNMVWLKIVFTSKKYQLFKKLYEEDPDMQYEIVYYEKSKVIKEILPLKGKMYSTKALEVLCLINSMYP